MTIETEIKSAALRTALNSVLTGPDFRTIQLTQTYLDPDNWDKLLVLLNHPEVNRTDYGSVLTLATQGVPRTIRVRKISGQTEEYIFSLKGPKNTDTHSLVEVEFPIPKELYDSLLATGTKGWLEKTRYIFEGKILLEHEYELPIAVHVDDLKTVQDKPITLPFLFIEVEFTTQDGVDTKTQMEKFNQGQHTVAWWPRTVELDAEFSMKKIAESGLTDTQIQQVIEQLTS